MPGWDSSARRPPELARYWEITLEFLKIATEFWPKHLYVARPNRSRHSARPAHYARGGADFHIGSTGPVIAAGSTGSVKATATLLAAIARLPNGAVVLPGLDQHLDPEAWDAIGISEHEPAGAGHPQVRPEASPAEPARVRDSVVPLAQAGPALHARDRFVSDALRPSSTVEKWSELQKSAAADNAAALAA